MRENAAARGEQLCAKMQLLTAHKVSTYTHMILFKYYSQYQNRFYHHHSNYYIILFVK